MPSDKQVTFEENPQMKINSFKKQKPEYLIDTWLDNALKSNRVFQSVHGGSLQIMFTVPLSCKV